MGARPRSKKRVDRGVELLDVHLTQNLHVLHRLVALPASNRRLSIVRAFRLLVAAAVAAAAAASTRLLAGRDTDRCLVSRILCRVFFASLSNLCIVRADDSGDSSGGSDGDSGDSSDGGVGGVGGGDGEHANRKHSRARHRACSHARLHFSGNTKTTIFIAQNKSVEKATKVANTQRANELARATLGVAAAPRAAIVLLTAAAACLPSALRIVTAMVAATMKAAAATRARRQLEQRRPQCRWRWQ